MRHQTTSPLSRVGPTASIRDAEPDFIGPIENVTVALGKAAVLTCSVSDLGDYKVGLWNIYQQLCKFQCTASKRSIQNLCGLTQPRLDYHALY